MSGVRRGGLGGVAGEGCRGCGGVIGGDEAWAKGPNGSFHPRCLKDQPKREPSQPSAQKETAAAKPLHLSCQGCARALEGTDEGLWNDLI